VDLPDASFTPVCLQRTPSASVETSECAGAESSPVDAPAQTITAPARVGDGAPSVDVSSRTISAPARVGDGASRVDTLSRTISAPARLGTEPSVFDAASPTSAKPARLDETRMSLSGPQRYSVQFTASEEYVALVEEARALLAHALPSGDTADVHLRAMQTFVAALKKRRFAVSPRASAQTARPGLPAEPAPSAEPALSTEPVRSLELVRSIGPAFESNVAKDGEPPPPFPAEPAESSRASGCDPSQKAKGAAAANESSPLPRQRGRYVPAAVRRAVFERDGHRCAFVDERGERCRETARLELHHHEPFARGGPSTVENLSLHCAAHNALAAEYEFGRDLVLERRDGQAHFSERSVAREELLDP
jgi:hypothetical protein